MPFQSCRADLAICEAIAVGLLCLFLGACEAPHNGTLDPQLALEIGRMKAIDNHAHPKRVLAGNDKDDEYDALPVGMMEPFPLPVRMEPATGGKSSAMRKLLNDGQEKMTYAYLYEDHEAKQKV